VIFSYPCTVVDAPVTGSLSEYCHTVWCGKTTVVWLPDVEVLRYIQLFGQNTGVLQTDKQMDILRQRSLRYA